MKEIPRIAIVGHPNEGKSSVLSTLAEDDAVAVSPFPGETRVCDSFPVKVDGETVITLIDTPGFQNPRRTLVWMKESGLTDDALLQGFIRHHERSPGFAHDCELLRPLLDGAAVIYVVDASRPMLAADESEMEILRLVNRPRMALLNLKENDTTYLEAWTVSFRRHFNVVRTFNAHEAVFSDRINLIESLKSMHQRWEPALERAIEAFRQDRSYRRHRAAEELVRYLEWAQLHTVSVSYARESNSRQAEEKARNQYMTELQERERKLFQSIKSLHHHRVYDFQLPDRSILHDGLFAERTWQVLGFTRKQLVMTATGAGATAGALVDLATAGLTFGVFTSAGAIAAGAGAFLKGKDLARFLQPRRLGGSMVRIGPNKDPQMPFILLDRALLYHNAVASHAHGNRKSETSQHISPDSSRIRELPPQDRVELTKWLHALAGTAGGNRAEIARLSLTRWLQDVLAQAEKRQG
jgi:hypothetical protein